MVISGSICVYWKWDKLASVLHRHDFQLGYALSHTCGRVRLHMIRTCALRVHRTHERTLGLDSVGHESTGHERSF